MIFRLFKVRRITLELSRLLRMGHDATDSVVDCVERYTEAVRWVYRKSFDIPDIANKHLADQIIDLAFHLAKGLEQPFTFRQVSIPLLYST